MEVKMVTRRALLAGISTGLAAASLGQVALAAPMKAKKKYRPAAIAKEAFIYGFPMVMNYAVMYQYFIDKASPEYKTTFNQIYNTARVYTPEDTAVVTPNSDTPYSFVGFDLRAEPLVITTPEIEKDRYFSIQFIDLYTFNFGYAGSRTTGNGAQRVMVAGPHWKGETPAGVTKVIQCETEFGVALIRTQLFNAADLDNVKKIQAGYKAQPLSAYLGKEAPKPAPEIAWPKIDKAMADADPFNYLAFMLQFCPPIGGAAVERPLRGKFAAIGLVAGKPFPAFQLGKKMRARMEAAMKQGLEDIKEAVANFGGLQNGWRIATNGFGDRQMNDGNWLMRAGAAMAGIYGNDAAEALYPILAADSDGNKPDCSTNKYTLTFPANELPPANAFWSVTMYDGKTQLLVANPIARYLINSPMLPNLKKNTDGSITLYLQFAPPEKDKVANWLPAPKGPIYVVMRLYWPKEEALNGTWKPPAVMRAA
jgi:hypothetical protein